jgi:hypothetical protein
MDTRQHEHACNKDCYHNTSKYLHNQQRRGMHERIWNGAAGRRRQPYSKTVTVPLHLVGVLPLIVPDGMPRPSPEDIKAAQKEHRRRRNNRRRKRQ